LDVAGRHGSAIHHPSTMVPTYGAGRVTEVTEEIIISLAGRPQCNMLCIARGKQRPGKNAIAFGERHFSAGLIAV